MLDRPRDINTESLSSLSRLQMADDTHYAQRALSCARIVFYSMYYLLLTTSTNWLKLKISQYTYGKCKSQLIRIFNWKLSIQLFAGKYGNFNLLHHQRVVSAIKEIFSSHFKHGNAIFISRQL